MAPRITKPRTVGTPVQKMNMTPKTKISPAAPFTGIFSIRIPGWGFNGLRGEDCGMNSAYHSFRSEDEAW